MRTPVRTSAPANSARQNDPGSTQPPWGNQKPSQPTGMPASSDASARVTGRIMPGGRKPERRTASRCRTCRSLVVS